MDKYTEGTPSPTAWQYIASVKIDGNGVANESIINDCKIRFNNETTSLSNGRHTITFTFSSSSSGVIVSVG